MNRVIESEKDMLYYSNLIKLEGMATDEMKEPLIEIRHYVQNLLMDRWAYNEVISRYQYDRNKAILHNRDLSKKVEELTERLELENK